MNPLQLKASKLFALWGMSLIVAAVPAQHELDALFGFEAGTAKIMQPPCSPFGRCRTHLVCTCPMWD